MFGLLLVISLVTAGVILDCREYNKGVCRKCGGCLTRSGGDMQRGRHYVCPDCGHECWVSYPFVDSKPAEIG